jgi:branched-chain amino acid transport system substrate-binding protein
MLKKTYLVLFIVVILCAIIIPACAAPTPAPVPTPKTSPTPAPTVPATPIKIGVMYPLTGPMAMTGQNMVNTTKFAFNEINYEIAGRKVELIFEDSAASPQMSVDKARKLVENDKVAMIMGGLIGAEKMSISSVVNKAGVPYIIPSPSTWKITEEGWSFLAGGSNFQHPSVIGAYAYDEMNLRKVTCMSRDDADGRDYVGAFKDAFIKKGGQVIQEQYSPFGSSDYAPYLSILKDADAVAGWQSGADAIRFLSQYHEFGIRKRMPLVAVFLGSFFQPFILNSLPPGVAEAMLGEKCPSQWSPMAESAVSKKFVEAFRKATNNMPSEADSAPYSSAILGIEALKAIKGDTTPEKLRQALLALDIEVPEGRIRFDSQTRCAYRDIYIIKVDKVGDKYTTSPVKLVKGVPPKGL